MGSAGKFSPAWHPFSQASLRFSLNQDTKQTGEAWRKVLTKRDPDTYTIIGVAMEVYRIALGESTWGLRGSPS